MKILGILLMATAAINYSSPALYDGAVEVKTENKPFSELGHDDHIAHHQKIQQYIESQDDKPTLVFGETTQTPFRWEMVTYERNQNSFFKQFQVAWRIFFGRKNVEANSSTIGLNNDVQPTTSEATHDFFCQEGVINKQQVFERKHIRVLYDKRPVAEKHFLVISKEHRKNIRELNAEEYAEAMEITQMVMQKLGGYKGYFYHKKDREAGQTVPHWHMHLIITESPRYDFLTRVGYLWKMTFGTKQLTDAELTERVDKYRAALAS